MAYWSVAIIQMWGTVRQLLNQTPRRVSRLRTSARRTLASTNVSATSRRSDGTNIVAGRLEMDSHADTIVFGRNFLPLSFTGCECDVSPYTDDYDSIKNIPIATAATAWTCLDTAQTYILVFQEGLWMPDSMPNSLINPNQLRTYGTVVQDKPFSSSPMYIEDVDGQVLIPLVAQGTTIVVDTRTPTSEELMTCPHVVLSSKLP